MHVRSACSSTVLVPPRSSVAAPIASAAKRLLDISGSVVLLVLLAPLMIAIAVVIRVSTPGPALFRQIRLGRDERSFVILKFRTMRVNCDQDVHRHHVQTLLTRNEASPNHEDLYKLSADPRVTRVGVWLRRTSLDELPQLINVLLGHMSLVGPRPVLAYEAVHFRPEERLRFAVRPGLTGLWQVSGRSRISFQDQLALDTRYVREQSLGLDLVILLRTIPTVMSRGTR